MRKLCFITVICYTTAVILTLLGLRPIINFSPEAQIIGYAVMGLSLAFLLLNPNSQFIKYYLVLLLGAESVLAFLNIEKWYPNGDVVSGIAMAFWDLALAYEVLSD